MALLPKKLGALCCSLCLIQWDLIVNENGWHPGFFRHEIDYRLMFPLQPRKHLKVFMGVKVSFGKIVTWNQTLQTSAWWTPPALGRLLLFKMFRRYLAWACLSTTHFGSLFFFVTKKFVLPGGLIFTSDSGFCLPVNHFRTSSYIICSWSFGK